MLAGMEAKAEETLHQRAGSARQAAMTKEQRIELARKAAKAKWDKKKAQSKPTDPPVAAAPRPPQRRRTRPKRKKAPQDHLTFNAALKAAEERLPEAIREQAEAATRYTMLGAEIGGLQNTIYALRNWQRSLALPALPGMQAPAFPSMMANPRDVSLGHIMSDQYIPPMPTAQTQAPALVPTAIQNAPQTSIQVPHVELPFIPGRAGGGALGTSELGGEVLADDPDENQHLNSSDMNKGSWV